MSVEATDKMKEYVKRSFEDLIKDKVKLSIELLILSAIFYYKNNIYDILFYDITIWKAIALFTGLFIIYYLIKWFISTKKYDVKRFDLLWKIIVIKNRVLSLKGPFCPDCDCDVSHILETPITKGEILSCPKCQKEYPIKATSIKRIRDDVKQIVESDLKSNKILDIDFSFYILGMGSFKLKNKGIFEVTNLNIQVNADIENQYKNIGTYHLDNIVPNESKDIWYELQNNILKLLEDSNLINIFALDFPETYDDIMGYEQTVWRTYEYLRLKKEFKATVFVDISYNLEKRQKTQNSKYLLEFTDKDWEPHEYNEFADDCDIKLQMIS